MVLGAISLSATAENEDTHSPLTQVVSMDTSRVSSRMETRTLPIGPEKPDRQSLAFSQAYIGTKRLSIAFDIFFVTFGQQFGITVEETFKTRRYQYHPTLHLCVSGWAFPFMIKSVGDILVWHHCHLLFIVFILRQVFTAHHAENFFNNVGRTGTYVVWDAAFSAQNVRVQAFQRQDLQRTRHESVPV